jgi:hypothetical protein
MTTEILMVSEVDCSTGVQIERPMTEAEIADWEATKAESLKIEAEREVTEQAKAELKASAKAKLIAGEPLTEEEAALLVI